ncbi:hypothetical protein [Mesorhizobium sp.]|uniref:hypothetical protein n=1 Tax=Mesorhizobium sp. TaxID=1871066 RepID=UPI0025E8F7CE|nr:hypothetical protein [Mesorhizobium sp.]
MEIRTVPHYDRRQTGWEMDDQYTVFLIGGGTGGDEQAVFTLRSSENLTCSYRDKVIEAEEEDYFEALFQIRQQLELDGLLPFCYGASGNVYPEGTVIEMSRGLIACKVKMGSSPKRLIWSTYLPTATT